jgi:hypothetical protein
LIVALVEAAKQATGMPARWAPLASVGVGLLISVGYHAASVGSADARGWADAAIGGLALGLCAGGLYSGFRATRPTGEATEPR